MKEPKLLKKINITIKRQKEKLVLFTVILIVILGVIYRVKESYAIETFEGNRMNTFPKVISDHKEEISQVYFINDTENNISSRYNNANIKADLTYYATGKVYGWLEKDTSDTTKYILYIGSNGKTYLNTGNYLFYIWTNVKTIDFSNADTSNVTDMSSMFYG